MEEMKAIAGLSYQYVIARVEKLNPDACRIEGFDDCIKGACITYSGFIYMYDEAKVIEKLKRKMSEEQAWEYYDTEILSKCSGKDSPVFYTEVLED